MKSLGRLAALAGLLGAVWLFWRGDPATIFGLLRAAGLSLVLVALLHALPMLVNARIWQLLIRDPRRPGWRSMFQLVWIRESVNGLLPVARLGGEVVSFRLLRRLGVSVASAVASLVVDTQLLVVCQLLFTLAAVGFLLDSTHSDALRLAGRLAWALAGLGPVVFLFAAIQYANPFQRLGRIASFVTGGRSEAFAEHAERIDLEVRSVWQERATIARCLLGWLPLQCLAVSLEIWAALWALGQPIAFSSAVAYEILIQAISSAAFFVPGGLGVQEGGFVLIGGVLGLPPSTCLALAASRRVRDLLVFGAGLVAWQVWEREEPSAPILEKAELEECR